MSREHRKTKSQVPDSLAINLVGDMTEAERYALRLHCLEWAQLFDKLKAASLSFTTTYGMPIDRAIAASLVDLTLLTVPGRSDTIV